MSLAKLGECFDAYVCLKEARKWNICTVLIFDLIHNVWFSVGTKKLSKAEMAKATVKLINRGLGMCFISCCIVYNLILYSEEITGVKGLTMAYSKYEETIIAVHKVCIKGWPSDVPQVSPQLLSKVEDLRELYDAWSEGQAAWRKLTLKEIQELKGQHEPLADHVKQLKKVQGSWKQKHSQDEETYIGESLSDDWESSRRQNKNKSKARTEKWQHVEKPEHAPKEEKKAARKGKSGVEGQEKQDTMEICKQPSCNSKGKALVVPDGIEDENEGESDEYVDNDE